MGTNEGRSKNLVSFSSMEGQNKKLNNNNFFLSLFIPVLVFGLLGNLTAAIPGCKDPKKTKAELEFWSVYDDSDVFNDLIKDFRNEYPNIKINYYKKSPSAYESELINALAAGRGPDIFAIHNTWLPKHIDKIAPMPEGSEDGQMTTKEFRDTFVDVAFKDFVALPGPSKQGEEEQTERIYALPLFVDTLALYWNKDAFNSEGIAEPPKDWHEFNDAVARLVKRDESGNIVQAGASLGTAKNINRGTDVLSALMLQTGAVMVDDKKQSATFDRTIVADSKTYEPAVSSLVFYTDFANPLKKVYTWNDRMHYSIDAFVEGKSAMMINYAYHLSTIKAKEPHLRFGIASLPQPKDAQVLVNYANYWGLTVAAGSNETEIQYSWIFLKWLAQKPQAQRYLEFSKRPASRRDLVSWQQSDLDLGVFAKQSLSARSWYQVDNLAIENIFSEMIESVNYNQLSAAQAIEKAAKQVTLLMGGK